MQEKLVNIELERQIIGKIISNNDLYWKVCTVIKPEHFGDLVHADLWKSIKHLMEETSLVSRFSLHSRYSMTHGEEGKFYIDKITDSYGLLNIPALAKELVDLWVKRQVAIICEETLSKLAEGEIADRGEDMIAGLAAKAEGLLAKGGENNVTLKDNFYKIVDDLKDQTMPEVFKTGIGLLDDAMGGGLQAGRVYAIEAATKVGKTLLAGTICTGLNNNDVKHLFVCAEMGSYEISMRILGAMALIPEWKIRQNGMKDVPMQFELGAVATAANSALIFEDEPGIEFDRLKAVVERHVIRSKIKGFVLDYYQLVSGCPKNSTQAQHLEEVGNWIHRVCKRHKIWSVILVQTNDEGKMYGSRGLSRSCDQTYTLERPTDDKGKSIGSFAWLKMVRSRYTATNDIGDQSNPSLRIHANGTHFEENPDYKKTPQYWNE